MISITNAKVAGFTPRWATFRGFSILFDNPGRCLTRAGRQHLLHCDLDGDPALGFYRSLRDSLARLDLASLTNTYLFCPLPPSSYHVTVWDGGNDANVGDVVPDHRHELELLLAGLPATLSEPNGLTALAARSPLVIGGAAITFRYDRLYLWGHSGLVALLAPADAASANRLREIEASRRALSAQCQQAYGISASDRYLPHVSLGYFANREGAQLAAAMLETWEGGFAGEMAGQLLPLTHASVYGFTDMATFFATAAAPG
jgi:hypothetical protein